MKQEIEVKAVSGWLMLFVFLLMLAVVITLFVSGGNGALIGTAVVLLIITIIIFPFGFVVIEPNGSSVLLLAGSYRGTIKESGFKWVIPFYSKRPVSLRVKTLNGEKLKVNDLAGNPVEIAAIVVWRVRDTFKACFEVDNYAQYVSMQSETAVRHLASLYPYDAGEDSLSLRRNAEEVSAALQKELQERLDRAGVEVMEARLSHLAYAQEIASAMLRKQQAAAIIAARQIIVEGAVGMVEMALDRLEQYKKLSLDEERKAAMVSNLLVVLCSDHAAQPVLNTGTLY